MTVRLGLGMPWCRECNRDSYTYAVAPACCRGNSGCLSWCPKVACANDATINQSKSAKIALVTVTLVGAGKRLCSAVPVLSIAMRGGCGEAYPDAINHKFPMLKTIRLS